MPNIHPIKRNDYLILTRPIEPVMASLVRWLQLNYSGTMIWGQRRLGKSHCAEFIKRYLAATLGYKISVSLLCVRKHDVVRESDFLDELIGALGATAKTRTSKDKKMELIINRLLVLARRCPVHKVILVLDDAQRLQGLHFEILMSLQNELYTRYRVTLFTLLVGQPQLLAKRELLIASGEKQITARMMADVLEFVGNRSLKEVEFALARFDNHCFYPAKSGISFSAGLAPEAWKRGWRLASEADSLWKAYVARREEASIEPSEEISMAALTTMATYIYFAYASQPNFNGLTPDQIADVVNAAGMLQLETPSSKNGDDEKDGSGDDD